MVSRIMRYIETVIIGVIIAFITSYITGMQRCGAVIFGFEVWSKEFVALLLIWLLLFASAFAILQLAKQYIKPTGQAIYILCREWRWKL